MSKEIRATNISSVWARWAGICSMPLRPTPCCTFFQRPIPAAGRVRVGQRGAVGAAHMRRAERPHHRTYHRQYPLTMGKVQPAIVGGVLSVIFYLMMFGNIGSGTVFVVVFAIAYISSGMSATASTTSPTGRFCPRLRWIRSSGRASGAFCPHLRQRGHVHSHGGLAAHNRRAGQYAGAWF